jgi:hypothetical protein
LQYDGRYKNKMLGNLTPNILFKGKYHKLFGEIFPQTQINNGVSRVKPTYILSSVSGPQPQFRNSRGGRRQWRGVAAQAGDHDADQ